MDDARVVWCYNLRMVVDKANPAGPVIETPEEPSLESQSLESEAIKLLTLKDYEILKSMCVAIGKDGMTVEEACRLANVPHEHFKSLAAKHPIIGKIISLKELEYKRSLLKSLSAKARSGDDKISQWLLEKRYPDEFGSKKKGGGGSEDADPLGSVIAFIQEHGDTSGIIQRRTAIVAVPAATKKPVGGNPLIHKLQTFLS